MAFKKKNIPWNKGTKGLMKPNQTSFKKGVSVSEKTQFEKGQTPWNAGKKGLSNNGGYKKGHMVSDELKEKISATHKGKTPWNKGKKGIVKFTTETRKKMSESQLKRLIGYTRITPLNKALRESFEYNEWRIKVFERDSYTCQDCGQVGGRLQADHIKLWSQYPDLRLEVSNGQTLCIHCHRIKTVKDMRINWRNQYSFMEGEQK